MFSGIIQAKGQVLSISKETSGLCVTFSMPRGWKFKKGDSVAVDGICSTVVSTKQGVFEVGYMQETLRASTAKEFKKGSSVNLERSLRLGEELHGHFVQGHVDVVGIVENIRDGEVTICIPQAIAKFIAQKGSVAVNGVSLTVSKKERTKFAVALIPLTLSMTNLGGLKKGSRVNIETDMLARYLDSLLATKRS